MDFSEQKSAAEPDVRLLQKRVESLEHQVADLTRQLDQLTGRVARGSDAPPPEKVEPRSALLPESIGEQISPQMEKIIARMNQGQTEEAFGDLKSIPEEELATQPVSVALVAAALCLQRGDHEAGLRAVKKVRGLTDDPRVLRILKKLEQQAVAQQDQPAT